MACNITNFRFGTSGFVQCDGLVNQGFLFRGQIVVVNESQSLNSAGFDALRYLTVGGALDAKRASFGFAGSALLMRLKRNGSQGRAIPVDVLPLLLNFGAPYGQAMAQAPQPMHLD